MAKMQYKSRCDMRSFCIIRWLHAYVALGGNPTLVLAKYEVAYALHMAGTATVVRDSSFVDLHFFNRYIFKLLIVNFLALIGTFLNTDFCDSKPLLNLPRKFKANE